MNSRQSLLKSLSARPGRGVVVAVDIPFGEVVEVFSRVRQNWTIVARELD